MNLSGLVTRETGGAKVILPVWHNLDAEEVRTYSPVLADRVRLEFPILWLNPGLRQRCVALDA